VLILFNKPFRVLSQFRDTDGRATLGDYVDVPGVYPAGRLDYDSEGLILLTDDGKLQARISQPKSRTRKIYLAQVEGVPTPEQLARLVRGVELKDGVAKAVSARQVDEPAWLWNRDPPIRYRASIPDTPDIAPDPLLGRRPDPGRSGARRMASRLKTATAGRRSSSQSPSPARN
jgi:23S rRNA pseudouridine2457 synthase